MKIIIIVSVNNEVNNRNLSYHDWCVLTGDGAHSLARHQTNYKIAKRLSKKINNCVLIESDIYSYQNQENPTNEDIVILVDGADRYGYAKRTGFELCELSTYKYSDEVGYEYFNDDYEKILATLLNVLTSDVVKTKV